MPKSKTPFFSLGARGTVGGVLTAQKRGGDTILRSTPVPTDPYSLKQAYQRWDYRAYAYQWTLLSNSEKQVYRTTGSRYHITGFSQFMRVQLKTLPDLAGRWRLDEMGEAIAYDSSKQGNNGVIVGASPIAGRIAGALSFDGINDYVALGTEVGNLALTGSIWFWMKPHPTFNIQGLIINHGGGWGRPGWAIFAYGTEKNVRFQWQEGVDRSLNSATLFALDEWTFYLFTHDGTTMRIYQNNILDANTRANAEDASSPLNGYMGYENTQSALAFKGIIDEVGLSYSALDETQRTRLYERGYPA